jgi:hypothetical protein
VTINFIEKTAIEIDPSKIMFYGLKRTPDKWQIDLLRKQPNDSLLLCSRQAGKSTTSAAMASYEAIFNPGALILIVSKAFRQAEELFRIVRTCITSLIHPSEIERENQTTLELTNGSRVISLPGKEESIRSFSSVSLLIIDEAAQVSDALYATVRPMLAVSQGKILALTTPYGKRGWFFKAWAGDTDWYKVKITADDCPRITEEFIEREMEEVGEWWVKQEYFCEFVDTEEQLITYDLFKSCLSYKETSWTQNKES